jgi:hypothetical protein
MNYTGNEFVFIRQRFQVLAELPEPNLMASGFQGRSNVCRAIIKTHLRA